jgi:hypothetical protein
MKTKIFSALLMGFLFFDAHSVFGQEAKTLFSKDSMSIHDIGFFVSPLLGVTELDGSNALFIQLRGGVNLNDKVTLGAYYTESNDVLASDIAFQGRYWDYSAVGGFAEFTILAKRLFHITFPIFVGYGEVDFDNNDRSWDLESEFIEIEPAALLEINLHKFIRLNLGAGYRFTGQLDQNNSQVPKIDGLNGYVGLKFGLFR